MHRPRLTTTEPEIAWWESYGDPVLSDLIRRAARENRDVKIAAERVRAARAGETISRSWLFPSIGASASGSDTEQRLQLGARRASRSAMRRVAAGGLDVSWEIDLAGRLRAGAPRPPRRTRSPRHTASAACACSS